jgi:hypothetical protein
VKIVLQKCGAKVNNPLNNIHILIWEGEDTYESMVEYAVDFINEMVRIGETGLQVGDRLQAIDVLVGGDLKFMNEAWGQCGASAKQPCFWCYVKVSHYCTCHSSAMHMHTATATTLQCICTLPLPQVCNAYAHCTHTTLQCICTRLNANLLLGQDEHLHCLPSEVPGGKLQQRTYEEGVRATHSVVEPHVEAGYTCGCCGKTISENAEHGPNTAGKKSTIQAARRAWQQLHHAWRHGLAPFVGCAPKLPWREKTRCTHMHTHTHTHTHTHKRQCAYAMLSCDSGSRLTCCQLVSMRHTDELLPRRFCGHSLPMLPYNAVKIAGGHSPRTVICTPPRGIARLRIAPNSCSRARMSYGRLSTQQTLNSGVWHRRRCCCRPHPRSGPMRPPGCSHIPETGIRGSARAATGS